MRGADLEIAKKYNDDYNPRTATVKKLIFIFIQLRRWRKLAPRLHGKYKKSCSWQFSVQVLDNLMRAPRMREVLA